MHCNYFLIEMIEYYFTIACKMFWKWKKQSPKEACLSHREHCFWNALSVVPPLNLWLLDITLIMSNICIIYVYISGRSEANWKLKTQQTGHVVLAQACVSWPTRAELVFRRWGPLKRQDLNHGLSDRGGIPSENWLWALKPINLF